MALRAPMLLLLSGTFAGGVAATHLAPKVLSALVQSETSAPTVVATAEAASEPQPVKEASSTSCKEPVWPYLDRSCGSVESGSKPERQVRVISTDRDAPSRVPIPAPAAAPAPPVEVAALPEAPVAAEPTAPAQEVAANEGETQAATPVPALPPGKPTPIPTRREIVAKTERVAAPSVPATERVEATASINPAAPVAAKPRQPARRQVARVERPRHDMERIRQARRNFDEVEDTVVQTTTYQYADGRQLVFRSEPRQPERRRWLEPEEPIRRMEVVQPARPARDGILGWLTQ